MLDKIIKFLGIKAEDREHPNTGPDSPLHMAAAALLVHVSLSHNGFSPEERVVAIETLKDHFHLNDEKAEHILKRATVFEENAIDLHSFTRVINDHLEQDGRQDIIRFLWRIAFADNHLDGLEEDAVKKIADLLGVSTRDRVLLKQSVGIDHLNLAKRRKPSDEPKD
jgi:uncharacterized tellurite resistance protein B-like protein